MISVELSINNFTKHLETLKKVILTKNKLESDENKQPQQGISITNFGKRNSYQHAYNCFISKFIFTMIPVT